ncbi:hypothetical protein [Chryseobacterium sp. GVT01B]|uniref:hypothetical protein n=1 Tax=Chryseobacterium sp. GVT01B TaxID=2862675 RepID=UPI001CBBEE48|nr:hypothetical protein [Chryseobacterium sp. GVT01B]
MKRTSTGILIFCCLFIFPLNLHAQNHKLDIKRIQYLHTLKQHLNTSWPTFGSSKYTADIAYFTPTETFITGRPISKTLKRQPLATYKKGNLSIEKTERLDTTSFHMLTAYENDDRSKLWYRYPVILCSDYDTTSKYIDDIPDTQTWATTILHEYFHGFQFRHPEFIRFANDSITVSITKLQSYYDHYSWFSDSIERENEILLACIDSRSIKKTKALFKEYKAKRSQRLLKFYQTEKFDLASQEEFMEKMEGSARYIEYQLYLAFKNIPINKELMKIDKYYNPSALKSFKLEDKPWMYKSNSIRYFYSTGFNMLRLLDKLEIDYKEHFFDDNNMTPYQLLNQKLSD